MGMVLIIRVQGQCHLGKLVAIHSLVVSIFADHRRVEGAGPEKNLHRLLRLLLNSRSQNECPITGSCDTFHRVLPHCSKHHEMYSECREEG
jgi:hypothetical protein